MKKCLIGLFILITVLFIVGCTKNVENPTLECDDFLVIVGETYTINPTSNVKKAKYTYSLDGDCASIQNNVITAKEAGNGTLTITIEGYDIKKTVNFTCAEEGLVIVGSNKVVINESVELKLEYVGIPELDDVVWRSSNNNVGRVSKGVVTGIAFGKFTITAKNDDYSYKFEMEVVRPSATSIEVENNKEEVIYEIGAEYGLNYSVLPELASQDVKIESDSDVITIDSNNKIKANKLGETTLKVTTLENNITKNVKVKVVENEAPKFIKQSDYEENIKVNFGSPLSATQGLKITDNSDGDITELVTTENNKDLQKLGTHEITLVAIDRAGNKATFKRTVTIEWQYNTKFIGHQGCFYAVPNTEEAFRYAASVMQYQALECDLKSTKDGVLVICHDNDFGGIDVATHTYAELSTAVETSKQFGYPQTYYGSKTYTGHICKFETYLDICAEYNVMPIIELKGAYGMDSGNTSQLLPLMNLLREKGLYETSVILTSMGDCIKYLRSKGETVKCQYLVNSANSDSNLTFCITNKCDISVNVTYGDKVNDGITDEYIKKYHDAGCEISVWTFTSYCDYSQVQQWIDKGVDYLTCDWHYLTEEKLTFK